MAKPDPDIPPPAAEIERLTRENAALRRDLEAERARFADLSSIASDWWWEMSADLRFSYVSDRFERLFHIKPADVIGKSRQDLRQADQGDAKWREHTAQLEAREPFRHFETTLIDGAGAVRHIVISGLPMFDAAGEFAGYRGVGVDLTDLRRHAEEARQRARVLEATLDNLEEGIGLIDNDLRVIAFNRRLLEFLRLRPEMFARADPFEKIVRHLAALGEYGDEDIETAVQRRLAFARSGKPLTMERTTPQGRILEIRTSPLPDGGFVIRYNDVTEARKRAAATHQAQKMEALGQLTGGIAHDFNNLLTVVLGTAELLGETTDAARQRALADTVVRAAERGSELARRLLAFARRQPLEPKTVDLNRLVDGIRGMLAQTLGEHIEVRFAPDASLRAAHVDAGQLETALLNLAINARDAMPDGGKLAIETRSVTVEPGAFGLLGEPPAGDYAMIAVSDTGVGMSADVKARAFDPFFTTKDFGKGSGLGLSMVYGFVRQSGGYVTIYSEPGHGTSVKLYFPPSGGVTVPVDDAPDGALEEARGAEAVLLVEDDPMVRGHVAAMLGDLGYRTVVAENGAEALGILESGEPIDLVFTDMVMPGGMSGRDVAEAARRLRPGVKILFTSGYTDDHVFARSQRDAAANFLSKPYRRRELAAKLREVLAD